MNKFSFSLFLLLVSILPSIAMAQAAEFTLTDATGTITNVQAAVATIGVAMLVVALVVRGF